MALRVQLLLGHYHSAAPQIAGRVDAVGTAGIEEGLPPARTGAEHPDLAIEPGLSAQPRDRALRVADDLGIGTAAPGAHAASRADPIHAEPVLPIARSLRQRGPGADPGAGRPARSRAQDVRQRLRISPLRGRRARLLLYYDRPMYRIEQALDGWQKVFA